MHLLFICYIDVQCTLLYTHMIYNIILFTSDCYKTFSLFTIHVYTQKHMHGIWFLLFSHTGAIWLLHILHKYLYVHKGEGQTFEA